MDKRTASYPFRPHAWSPLRKAMMERDYGALMQAVEDRSVPDLSGCLIWKGARSEPGYPRVFRAPIVYVHRLVSWAAEGFPGELADLPAVHHRCGRRACVRPAHLASVGTLANSLEAFARQQMTKRMKELEDVIRGFDPEHPVLAISALFSAPPLDDIPVPTPFEVASLTARVRQQNRSAVRARDREVFAARRFEQVLEARRLLARGASRAQAARAVGLDLSNLAYWEQKLEQIGA